MYELLEKIYPEHYEAVLKGVEDIKGEYADRFRTPSTDALSQKDSILITYGDAIQSKGEKPLKTLERFAGDYLQNRISAIHLLPCFPYSSDDGFSVIDYYEIDPELGDWKDVSRLGASFDLMFDAVVNHMSKSSKWFQAFLNDQEPYNRFFIEADPSIDHSQVVRPRALPLLHSFDKKGREVYVWTTFSEDQVDLNYANYQVFLEILRVLLHYAANGARYIRLDAIAFLWKEDGSSCIHLDQTHWVIRAYRAILDDMGTGTILITETNVPHQENISYFGNGTNEAHMVYNFSLPPLLAYSIHKKDVSRLAEWAQSLVLPGPDVCFFNFTASHDGVGVRPLQGIVSQDEIVELAEIALKHGGFVSYKNNEDGSQSPYELNCNFMDLITDPKWSEELRIRRFMLTQSVMLAMPGVPGIYYHSILGSENDRNAAIESGVNRRINREKLDCEKLIEQLGNPNSRRRQIFDLFSEMLRVRSQEAAFNPYAKADYSSNENLFIIIRKCPGSIVYTLHNFSDEDIDINAIESGCIDLFTEERCQDEYWTVPAYQYRWYKKNKQ